MTANRKGNETGIPPNHIVAIGASAGGLEAIHQFFDNLDGDADVSFIIIQHLSPDHKSLLVELIAKHTPLKVLEAEDGASVLPKHIYVIPPRKVMTISKGKLILTEKPVSNKPNHAIDIFFESLAKDAGRRAIGIVLSGTGTDGTNGLTAIKEAGGLVLVQDPETSRFDGMPISAIAAGNGVTVVPPEEMPFEVLQYVEAYDYPDLKADNTNENLLNEIFTVVKHETGCDFNYYKTPTILRRLARRMSMLKVGSVEQYINRLRRDEGEAKTLCKDFLIGVTRFFRDEEAYETIYKTVLPQLIADGKKTGQIKIWVVACSTGEEAYSVAILIDRYMREHKIAIEVKIFATDIDETSVEYAARGEYPTSISSHLSAEVLSRYFTLRGDRYCITPYIRKQIVFARHDVISSPPFIKNNMVSCRNMLIYMNSVLQKKLLSTFQYALEPNGYLVLGPTESIGTADQLEEIDRRWKIFRKKANTGSNPISLRDYYGTGTSLRSPIRTIPKPAPNLSDELRDVMLEDFGYAAMYINSSFDIKEASGAYEKYLTLPEKKLHLNLLKMASPDLVRIITNAFHKARAGNRKVFIEGASIRYGINTKLVNVIVQPAKSGQGNDLMLVVIGGSAIADHERPAPVEQHNIPDGDLHSYIQQLEGDVRSLRLSLQQAVEGLETTNEELQSTNEELLSSNEELQSSNEELQSLNEELHTLNTEHQLKIQELIELNDDLNNYFRSTEIGQIFVDSELRIRKFNPASANLVHLIDSDIGRQISDIANRLYYHNLIQDLKEVLETGNPIEREVKYAEDKTSLMRVMPYQRHTGQIDGLVITFVDITTLKALNSIIIGVFDASLSGIIALQPIYKGEEISDFRIASANRAARQLLRLKDDITHSNYRQVFSGHSHEDHFEQISKVLHTGRPLHLEYNLKWDNDSVWYTLVAVKMDNNGVLITLTDITARKTAEDQLRAQYNELMLTRESLKALANELEEKVHLRTRALSESEERFRLITRATNDALWDWNITSNSFWWGDSFYEQFGYQDEQEAQSFLFWLSHLHPDERTAVRKSLDQIINSDGSQWSVEHSFLRADGSYARVLDRAYILKDEYGTPYRVLGSMLDISTLRAAQARATEREAYSRELESINHELEQSNYALQQFASVASHDLKEPLRKIEVFSGMLRNQLTKAGIESDYLPRITQSSSRMTMLIDDLLKYSGLSRRSGFEEVNLNFVLHEVLSDLEVSIQEKHVVIECDHLPKVDAVAGQMRQVFQNIISNAVKFMRDDVIPRINVSCKQLKEKSFESPPDDGGPYLLILISDNGIGFDMEYLTRIFIIFQRLHTKEEYKGSGIGLAIVKKIIDQHNGLITAESKPGKGTTFKMILPIHQQDREILAGPS